MKLSFIYILSNSNRTVLYIGVTSDLFKRITQHKNGTGSLFTRRYQLKELIYFEEYTSIDQAIAREKQLKNWKKEWKWNIIKSSNSEFIDLYSQL